ncbi:TPA: hypothetical protein T7O95_000993 [Streptococcus suis]|nr:hypothetical protein [Streptococcus suis]
MKQNDFYEVNGCTEFIPVTINETYNDGVDVTVHSTTHTFRMVVKQVYRFPKGHESKKMVVPQMIFDVIESFDEDIDHLHEHMSRQSFEVRRWLSYNEREFYEAWLAYPNIAVEKEVVK